MQILITTAVIKRFHNYNLKLQTQIQKQLTISIICVFILLAQVIYISLIATDYPIRLPQFVTSKGEITTKVPELNVSNTELQLKGYARRTSAELLSISFNTAPYDTYANSLKFIDGMSDNYLYSIYGHTNLYAPPLQGTYVAKVMDDSLIVTLIAYGRVARLKPAEIIDGKVTHTFALRLWQSSEGIGDTYRSKSITAQIQIQEVPRSLSKDGVLVREFKISK